MTRKRKRLGGNWGLKKKETFRGKIYEESEKNVADSSPFTAFTKPDPVLGAGVRSHGTGKRKNIFNNEKPYTQSCTWPQHNSQQAQTKPKTRKPNRKMPAGEPKIQKTMAHQTEPENLAP